MEQKLSIKQVLIDILSIKKQVIDFNKGSEKYDILLSFLDEKDYYNDDNLSLPNLTEIEKETNLKTYQIRKQLKDIYEQFFDYENGKILDFKNVEIIFNLECYKKYASFRTNNLNYLPRIGENITIPFLKAKAGTDFFYVQDIRHYFDECKQTIDIELKSGYFNSYWYQRKHKALELGELGIMDDYKLNEYQQKEKLGLRL